MTIFPFWKSPFPEHYICRQKKREHACPLFSNASHLLSCALYRNRMAFPRLGSFRNSYLEKTILVAGLYLVRFASFGKFQRSAEAAVGLLDTVIILFLHFFLAPFFTAEGQGIACNFDL